MKPLKQFYSVFSSAPSESILIAPLVLAPLFGFWVNSAFRNYCINSGGTAVVAKLFSYEGIKVNSQNKNSISNLNFRKTLSCLR